MNSTAQHITEIKAKIAKLEKAFPKGVPKGYSMTINLFYGGNKEIDINRVCIGGLYDEETAGNELINLMMRGLKADLKFWEKTAEQEIKELNTALLK